MSPAAESLEWSVQIAVAAGDIGPLAAGLQGAPHEIITNNEGDSVEGGSVLVLRVAATDYRDALGVAGELYRQARAHAGLDMGSAYVIGAVLPSYGFEPGEQLMLEARQHYDSGRYDLAVVRAQTACELYAVAALRHGLHRCFGDWHRAVAVAGHLRASLSDRRTQDLIALLTGEVVTEESWWPAYRAHLQRRNAIVHEGLFVSADEAASSLGAVEQCWGWLLRVWTGGPTRTGQ